MPEYNGRIKQIASHYRHIVAILDDNTLLPGKTEFSEDIQNEELTNVVSISTGIGLSLALKEDGTVGVLGGNHNELKEYARQLEDIKYVAAGFFVGGAVKKTEP